MNHPNSFKIGPRPSPSDPALIESIGNIPTTSLADIVGIRFATGALVRFSKPGVARWLSLRATRASRFHLK